ncbi:MAG: DUF285 domain-containing protein [Enterococcaceae bacterium]|jgi:surface protein|nr:DUF285 domain-containing protein [Enterococcaceae bacterium]MCI1919269.1 DUF285 domain-containing protein [Enterococcaceae bacterium]
MKRLFQNKRFLVVGIWIIVFSNFLPLLASAASPSTLYPYDAISVNGAEKDKESLVLERRTDAAATYVITLKSRMDGKLSVEKNPDAILAQLATAEQKNTGSPVVAMHQEAGKEYADLELKKGESVSFTVTLQEKGTLQELDALFTPAPLETDFTVAEAEPVIQPFAFKLFEIKTAATPAALSTSASSASTGPSTTSARAGTTTTAADAASDAEKRPQTDRVGAVQSGFIGSCPYTLQSTNLVIYPGDMGQADYPGSIDMKTLRTEYGTQIYYIKFVSDSAGNKIYAPASCEDLFKGGLHEADYGGVDTFTDLDWIDFGDHFDTSRVTDMEGMFQGNLFLHNIIGMSTWDTSQVTNLARMFARNRSLNSVGDISGWNTSCVTNMAGLFIDNRTLRTAGNLGKWDVSKVTNMQLMFNDCSNIRLPDDLNSWNTSNVTDMSFMFFGCTWQEKLGKISKWDTSSVTTMEGMFTYDWAITTEGISDLGSWDVSKVTNFKRMFLDTWNLSTLDFENWKISKGAVVDDMLSGSGISKIILGTEIKQTITLPGQKLRVGSKENGDWTAWVGVGTGSEAAPEGEVLTAKTYLSETNTADTYIIAKPKVKAIDLQVNDAWKPATGVPNIKFMITNKNAKAVNKTINEDAFGDAATFVTDPNGKILMRYLPATAFYDYQAQEDLANSNQNYWPLAEVPDAASPVATVYELQRNATSGTITPIKNPLYVVPKVVIHINAQDTSGNALSGIVFELDHNGIPVTQLGSKTFVQPVTGADGSYTIENYYIKEPGDYTLKIVKDLSAGYDPANGDTFTADTVDPTKTLINFGGTYQINVKLVKYKTRLPLTGGKGFGRSSAMILISGGILAVGLSAKHKKKPRVKK